MSSYLPLLREFIPSAASEVESDIHDYMSSLGPLLYASWFLFLITFKFSFSIEAFFAVLYMTLLLTFQTFSQLQNRV